MEVDCDRCEDGKAHVAMWDDDILCGRIDAICEDCYEQGERMRRPIRPPYDEDGELYWHIKWVDCPHCNNDHTVNIGDSISICPQTNEMFDVPLDFPDEEFEEEWTDPRDEESSESITNMGQELVQVTSEIMENNEETEVIIERESLESALPLFGFETDSNGYIKSGGLYVTDPEGDIIHVGDVESIGKDNSGFTLLEHTPDNPAATVQESVEEIGESRGTGKLVAGTVFTLLLYTAWKLVNK